MGKLYFSISELIHSDKAILHKINNMPDINSLDNMLNLIHYCLNPIRTAIKQPMIVTSGYRCKELNKLVGGADNSNHLSGCACDFIIQGKTPKEIIKFINAMNIEYDELINEYDKWVHISFRKGNNRQKSFKKE
jgi:hypothetical protein